MSVQLSVSGTARLGAVLGSAVSAVSVSTATSLPVSIETRQARRRTPDGRRRCVTARVDTRISHALASGAPTRRFRISPPALPALTPQRYSWRYAVSLRRGVTHGVTPWRYGSAQARTQLCDYGRVRYSDRHGPCTGHPAFEEVRSARLATAQCDFVVSYFFNDLGK